MMLGEKVLEENWLALYLCINKKFSSNKALIKMGFDKSCVVGKYKKYSDKEKEEIFNLKLQGKKDLEIAEAFNLSRAQVDGIVKYYKKNNK